MLWASKVWWDLSWDRRPLLSRRRTTLVHNKRVRNNGKHVSVQWKRKSQQKPNYVFRRCSSTIHYTLSSAKYTRKTLTLFLWYNNGNKRVRIQTKRQSLRLTNELLDNPTESKVEAFRNFVSKRMSFQKHLNPSYQMDKFFRGTLQRVSA